MSIQLVMERLSQTFLRCCNSHITRDIDFPISRYYGLNVSQILCRVAKVSEDKDFSQYGRYALQLGFPAGQRISERNN